MIAMVDEENSCHSSGREKVYIILDHHHRPLSTPVPVLPWLRNILDYLHKHTFHRKWFTFFVDENKTKKDWQGGWVIFETFCFGQMGGGKGSFFVWFRGGCIEGIGSDRVYVGTMT